MVISDNKQTNAIYKWVCGNLGNLECENTLTIGILDKEKNVIAGVIYSVEDKICNLTIYAENPMWCLPHTFSEIFKIGFDIHKCKIVKCQVSHNNKKINKLLWGLKFREEGLLRYARPDGSHERVFSLTEKEFKKQRWYRK